MKTGKMRAAKCAKYGPPEVFDLVEIDIPKPKNNEIQVAVKASAVTASDIFIRSSDLPLNFKIPMRLLIGILKPRKSILGLVFAGIVEDVGSAIKRFKPGDRVFGMTGYRFGAYAEYMCIKETDSKAGCISILPDEISFKDATALAYGGSLALQFMDKGEVRPNHNILIYGASGTSGTFASQYGKHFGAHVTAVCSTKHLEFLKLLGADMVIDYTIEDQIEPNNKFDFILDAVGKAKSSKFKESCRDALKDNGKYVSIDDEALILSSSRLDQISSLVIEGAVKPVLDKTFTLEQIVEAHRYVQRGHKKGGVAILIND
jgi:NADPH:quinone reductase-like Zn-dependent oxidoreductase